MTKREKLLQFAERVGGIRKGSADEQIDAAIARTREFFESLGVATRLSAYGIAPEAVTLVADRIERRGTTALGEREISLPPESANPFDVPLARRGK